jgi:APA family basic amino acid/polyamine antiporter
LHEPTRRFFLWYLLGGTVLYFIYGMWNSKLAKGVVVAGHESQPRADVPVQPRLEK